MTFIVVSVLSVGLCHQIMMDTSPRIFSRGTLPDQTFLRTTSQPGQNYRGTYVDVLKPQVSD